MPRFHLCPEYNCTNTREFVGVDGIEEGQYLDLPLTTVLLPTEELCQSALEILIARLQEKQEGQLQRTAPRIVKVPTHLIVGETA